MPLRWLWNSAFCLGAALTTACNYHVLQTPLMQAPGAQIYAVTLGQPNVALRCGTFITNFDEVATCQRANGTLQSFDDKQIAWRVRYFVRYDKMPCGEFPTRQEKYIFDMVTQDLYQDPDLNDGNRTDIRNAMFDGNVHCYA